VSPLAGGVLLAARVPLADSDKGKGSPIGLFVVLILVVATYLLYRSMSRHLRRLPERFPASPPAAGEAAQTQDAAEPAGTDPASADLASVEPGSTAPAGAAPDAAVRPGQQAGEGGERAGAS